MSDQFFCPDLSAATAVLTDGEAHHLLHVMRLKTGATISLFDGRGTCARGSITDVTRNEVRVAVESRQFTDLPSVGRLTVAAALPKGDRLKWMIEKLTEVGVDRFVPLISERSVVRPHASRIEKLSMTVVAAAKQSGRAWLMELGEPVALPNLMAAADVAGERLLFAHLVDNCDNAIPDSDGDKTVVIGPEGGFTDEEAELAQSHGAVLVSRPGPVMRTETAAVVFAVLAGSRCRTSESGSV